MKPEPLVIKKNESLVSAVVQVRNVDWAAYGAPKVGERRSDLSEDVLRRGRQDRVQSAVPRGK